MLGIFFKVIVKKLRTSKSAPTKTVINCFISFNYSYRRETKKPFFYIQNLQMNKNKKISNYFRNNSYSVQNNLECCLFFCSFFVCVFLLLSMYEYERAPMYVSGTMMQSCSQNAADTMKSKIIKIIHKLRNNGKNKQTKIALLFLISAVQLRLRTTSSS